MFKVLLQCPLLNDLFLYYYSTGRWGSYFAALIPAVNILRMLAIGLGIWKDEGTVKSMSRFGDYRLQN
jgi:farnesol kinase